MLKSIARGTLFDGKIDCYVVDDGGVHRHMIGVAGIKEGIGARGNMSLQQYLSGIPKRYEHLAHTECVEVSLEGGGVAKCYTAEHFSEVVSAYSDMLINGELHHSRVEMGKTAYRTGRAYQTLGIIAHIENATGYHLQRAKGDLEDTLLKLISWTPCEWDLCWDSETVKEICQLYRWEYDGKQIPHQFRMIVYMCYGIMVGEEVRDLLLEASKDSEHGARMHQHIKPELREGLKNMVRTAGRLAHQSATPEEWKRRVRDYFGKGIKPPARPVKKKGAIQSVMEFFSPVRRAG